VSDVCALCSATLTEAEMSSPRVDVCIGCYEKLLAALGLVGGYAINEPFAPWTMKLNNVPILWRKPA
jgi:hypothetical protein